MRIEKIFWFVGLFTLIILLFSCVTGPSLQPIIREVEYHSMENNIFLFVGGQIRGFTNNTVRQKELVIPNSIFGESVTSIGDNAFRKTNLTKVTIPSSIRSIGNGAFAENPLTELIIHRGTIYINDEAFLGNKLSKITIPESVEYIGKWAFHREAEDISLPFIGEKILAVITIGSNVEMDDNPFSINLEYTSNNGFRKYYEQNGSRSGTYYLKFTGVAGLEFGSSGKWLFTP